MIIGTNVPALIANKYMSRADKAASNAMYQLSSGVRLNSAKDDPSGMAISKKIRMQLKGLEAASSNSTNGISVTQTADGALNEMIEIMQRVRELSVHAANETLTLSDREIIQQEINELLVEVDNIASTTNFNGINLLDGSIQRLSYLSNGYGLQNLRNGNKVSLYYLSSTLPEGDYDFTVTKVGMPAYFNEGHLVTSATGEIGMKGVISINGEVINIEETDTIDDIFEKLREVCDACGIDVELDKSVPTAVFLSFATREAGSDQHIVFNGDPEILNWLGIVDTPGLYNTWDIQIPGGGTSTTVIGTGGTLVINGVYITVDATDTYEDLRELLEEALPDFDFYWNAALDTLTITAKEIGRDYPFEIEATSDPLLLAAFGVLANTYNNGRDIVIPAERIGTDAEISSQAVITGNKIPLMDAREIGYSGPFILDFSINGKVRIEVEATDTWDIIFQKLNTACAAKDILVDVDSVTGRITFTAGKDGAQSITVDGDHDVLRELGFTPGGPITVGDNPVPAADTPATTSTPIVVAPGYTHTGADATIQIGIATIHIKDGDTTQTIMEKIRKACEAQDIICDIDYSTNTLNLTTKNVGSGAKIDIGGTPPAGAFTTYPAGSYVGVDKGSTTASSPAHVFGGLPANLLLATVALDTSYYGNSMTFTFANASGATTTFNVIIGAGLDTLDAVLADIQTKLGVSGNTVELIDGRLVLKTAETGEASSIDISDNVSGNLLAQFGLQTTTVTGIDNGINGPAGYDHDAIVSIKGNLVTIKGKDSQEIVMNLEVFTSLNNDGTISIEYGNDWKKGTATIVKDPDIDVNPTSNNYGKILNALHVNKLMFTIDNSGPLHLQVGNLQNTHMFIDIPKVSTEILGVANLSLRTSELAQRAIEQCDTAQAYLLKVRTKVGAYENRLEATIKNIDTSIETTEKSKSKIEDTDMAMAMMKYTQQSVIVQAGLSILAQANQRPSQLLQILQ